MKTDHEDSEWQKCVCCLRLWKASSLEFEYCSECLASLVGKYRNYEEVTLHQRLKYAEFQDEDLAECVRLLWQIYQREYD